MKQVVERLKEHSIRPSLQRIAVLSYLMRNRIHPTVDKVYSDLAPEIPTLSKTTVYSTLKLLADAGAIKAITIDEKNIRYDADISEHAHFVCKKCGAIHDMQVENADSVKVLNPLGLVITESALYLRGYCASCSKDLN